MSIFNQDYANNYEDADIEAIFHKEKFKINVTDDDISFLKTMFDKSHDIKINNVKDYTKFIASFRRQFQKKIPTYLLYFLHRG